MEKRKNKTGKAIVVVFVLLCALGILGLIAYDAVTGAEFKASYVAMNTVVTNELKGYSSEKTSKQIEQRILEIENSYLSRTVAASEIGKINAAAGSTVQVSEYTIGLIKEMIEFAEKSGGALDISIGALADFWDIGGDNERVPSRDEILEVIKSVGFENIAVSNSSVGIPAGFSLDLGAVGKGVACDEAREILKTTKVKSAIISVGGSVLLYGGNEDGSKFRVGVRDPRGTSNDHMGVLSLDACCVSTSGDYEKFFKAPDGSVYHHIFNPETGYPANRGLISVTVAGENGMLCDALSTACFVLGYEKSLPLLEEYSAEAVFVTSGGEVIVTDGLSDSFELTDEKYTLVSGENYEAD